MAADHERMSEAIAFKGTALLVAAGVAGGPLYRACTVDRALWYVVTITGDPDELVKLTKGQR
jgi:hypothetical protein